ncbi:MAG: hypothetical protein LBF13_04185 [Campylobacteraceae bacterium]|jgi:hypothetical protein|nr:hypothetical protein [Campylobacteraceae bacterium]
MRLASNNNRIGEFNNELVETKLLHCIGILSTMIKAKKADDDIDFALECAYSNAQDIYALLFDDVERKKSLSE